MTTIGYPGISNQKVDVSFILPTPGNYNDQPDFKKYRQLVRGKLPATFTVPVRSKQNRVCLLW